MAEKTEEAKEVSTKKSGTEVAPAPARHAWPWPALGSLREELDEIFSDVSHTWPFSGTGRSLLEPRAISAFRSGLGANVPAIDVVEHDDNYVLTAELPGMDDQDIELSVSEDALTLKAEKKEERDETKDNVRVSERRFGSYQRTFSLPPNVLADKISAKSKNGLLEITLPKSEETKAEARKIEIG